MPISRKPKPKETPPGVDVDALIEKGGSVASTKTTTSKTKSVVLRLPTDLLVRIDQARATKPLKLPRHTWLLEAVVEKLERESN